MTCNKSIVLVVNLLSRCLVHSDTGDNWCVLCKLQEGHRSTGCVVTQTK